MCKVLTLGHFQVWSSFCISELFLTVKGHICHLHQLSMRTLFAMAGVLGDKPTGLMPSPLRPDAVLTILGQVQNSTFSVWSFPNQYTEWSFTDLSSYGKLLCRGDTLFSVLPRVCHSIQHSSSSFTEKMEVCVFPMFPSLLTNICLIWLYVTIVEKWCLTGFPFSFIHSFIHWSISIQYV